MKSLRIKNLRSLSDTGEIHIKPITILLGQNSSGKSTFLRTFPLLKQSMESRTRGPILWFGRLVDFGSYEDAHKNNSENAISFTFRFNIQPGSDMRYYSSIENSRVVYQGGSRILNVLDIETTLELLETKKKDTRESKLILKLEEDKIEMEFSEDGTISSFYVNNLNIIDFGVKYELSKYANKSFLPIITEIDSKKESRFEVIRSQISILKNLNELVINQIKKCVYRTTSKQTITKMAIAFGIGSPSNMLQDMKTNAYAVPSWKKQISNWTVDTEEFKYLRNLLLARCSTLLIDKCDGILMRIMKQVSYTGPIRATAERYYRTQDLAIDEVDFQGRNLAMFLRNLKESEMRNFSEWTSNNFGFKPTIQTSLGHISLKIRPNNSDKDLNIADTGFGFSQILPIITQLWLLSVFRRRVSDGFIKEPIPIMYAIEQPELHLHPRLQGTLADAFVTSVNAALKRGIDLRLVIETHSETLVNRLGHLIADKIISPDLINIVLFEASDKPGEIKVRNTGFDSSGYLSDWPLGFFEMELV